MTSVSFSLIINTVVDSFEYYLGSVKANGELESFRNKKILIENDSN